ncbi:MAG: HDOD domain-containing protein [Acidimicrobiales bacterium]
MDVQAISPEEFDRIVRVLGERAPRALLLAEKVESEQQLLAMAHAPISLFQGYYFKKPVVLERPAAISNNQAVLLQLAASLHADDVAFDRLTVLISGVADLAFQVLRLANSAALGPPRRLTSLHEAVINLGLSRLRRIVYILLATQDSGGPAELGTLGLVRGRFCAQLAASRTRRRGGRAHRRPVADGRRPAPTDGGAVRAAAARRRDRRRHPAREGPRPLPGHRRGVRARGRTTAAHPRVSAEQPRRSPGRTASPGNWPNPDGGRHGPARHRDVTSTTFAAGNPGRPERTCCFRDRRSESNHAHSRQAVHRGLDGAIGRAHRRSRLVGRGARRRPHGRLGRSARRTPIIHLRASDAVSHADLVPPPTRAVSR